MRTSANDPSIGEDPFGTSKLDSVCRLPVDSTVDSFDWFPDFNDVSSSWIPIDDNNISNDAGTVIDSETLGGLFHSSFSMWSVMDNSLQTPDLQIPTESFTM